MTGQGQGRRQYGTAEITAEVRAVNNRHLKLQARTSEGLNGLEPQIEALVRKSLKRGSLQLGVQLTGGEFESEYQLREGVLAGYIKQCRSLAEKMGVDSDFSIRDLLVLPGIVAEKRSLSSVDALPEGLVESVLGTVADALACLNRMRSAEGDAMQAELERQLSALLEFTTQIEQRAPVVLDEYRKRLESRLCNALAEVGSKLQESDLVRELLFMADKADIREEVVRLRSHVAQFQGLLSAGESQGRKLDFLIQEMFRESNTIGSKSGDAEIAQRVVDIKTIIEQMRELVQNVE